MAHSYLIIAETEEGIGRAHEFIESEFAMPTTANPDVMTLRHELFSVDDARRLQTLAGLSPTNGEQKVLILTANRFFHEAQNAVLKLFEEPPAGTILILVVPNQGLLLPTLRSRLIDLPHSQEKLNKRKSMRAQPAHVFLGASKTEREKIIAKLLDRTKSDKDEEKQAARQEAVRLLEELTVTAHQHWRTEKDSQVQRSLRFFLDDLSAFEPIMHERSAPLKLIFEHILITLPNSLSA